MNEFAKFINPGEDKKFLFFGGKGGVGKTTMAAATAIWMANQGYNTTIVSTDPTVSLSAIFHQNISSTEKTRINKVQNLSGININPSEATGIFQSRLSKTLSGLTETIGGNLISVPCAEEMAAFDQFVESMDDKEADIIVFDTAPTGHSLRELAMPFDWANYLQKQVKERKELATLMQLNSSDETISQLEKEKARYNQAIKTLKDKNKTIYTLVLLPAYLPIEETVSAVKDLNSLGIEVRSFIVNQMIPKKVIKGNRFLQGRFNTQKKYIEKIKNRFGNHIIHYLPLLESDVYNLDTLNLIGKSLYKQKEILV